jgi:toxin ParE1/3/4
LKVRLSERAEADLLGIGMWIERDDPVRAASYVDEVEQACLTIGEFPNRFPVAPEFGEDIRKRSHGEYLILYRVGADVTIVAIRHAARARKSL